MRQRAELTFKQNRAHGRHGWLRLTPAYSVVVVEQVLAEFGGSAERVLEPFSGTGTTPLSAAARGLSAVATDINPFLVWLARAKVARYDAADRAALLELGAAVGARAEVGVEGAAPPPLHNVERWWGPRELAYVTALRAAITEVPAGRPRDLLDVAFCRTMMGLSNAAFDHPSMSFKAAEDRAAGALSARWSDDVAAVAATVLENPTGDATIVERDARALSGLDGAFDLLVTSPPYPNRMSYVRELRPYLYWLDHVREARAAGELDWTAIGGTWGIATSRLSRWTPRGVPLPAGLAESLAAIEGAHPRNGPLMARYVHKYFEDMADHFAAAARLVRPGGTVHYVVGNAAFYGHVVPTERLFVDQLLSAGFRRAEARLLRKRVSKKSLFEYHVVGWR